MSAVSREEEHLHVPVSDCSCFDQQLISQSGLAMVYVCYDREVAYSVCGHLHNSPRVISGWKQAAQPGMWNLHSFTSCMVPLRLLHHRRSEVGLQQELLHKAPGESCVTVLCMTVSASPEPYVNVLARAWCSKLMDK